MYKSIIKTVCVAGIATALWNTAVMAQASWPVGATGKDSVTAKLGADGTLTVSGSGAMRNRVIVIKPSANEELRAGKAGEACVEIMRNTYETCRKNPFGIYNGVKCDGFLSEYSPDLVNILCNEMSGKGKNKVQVIEWPWKQYINGISKVIIEDGVTAVGNEAFEGAEKLTTVVIGNSVERVGAEAFYRCKELTSVSIGNSVTSIEKSAFAETKLTSVVFPSSMKSIDSSAFDEANLSSIVIPDNVTSIGDKAFRGNKNLTSVSIGKSVETIGNRAFEENTSLTAITIPNNVTKIGKRAFYNCSNLQTVFIGDGITSIEEGTFGRCVNLNGLTIGARVALIKGYALDGRKLKFISALNPTPPKVEYGNDDVNKVACILYVPEGSLYNMADFWKDFKNIKFGAPTKQDIRNVEEEVEREKEQAKQQEAKAQAPSYNEAGVKYHRKGDLDSAILNFSKAILGDPSDGVFYLNRGISYAQKGDYDKAIEGYSEAIPLLKPRTNDFGYIVHNPAYFIRARDYYTSMQDGKIENAGVFAMMYNDRADLYLQKGYYDKAIADISEAIRLEQTIEYHGTKWDFVMAMFYNNRGLAYLKKEDYDRAITDVKRAIELIPFIAEYTSNLGAAYVKKGDYENAIALCTKAIQLDKDERRWGREGSDPKNAARPYFWMGSAYMKIGTKIRPTDKESFKEYFKNSKVKKEDYNRAYAIALFEKSLELDPNGADVKNALEEAKKELSKGKK